MPGGLIQIATYGTQDLFLTGTPEITFFKVVYRRHTSFSMESIRVTFDDPTEFDGTSVVKIPKIGDLMHKTYVEILLPEINLQRETMPSQGEIDDLKVNVQNDKDNFQIIFDFMHINRTAFVEANNAYIAENNNATAVNDMINAITSTFEQGNAEIIDKMKNLLTLTPDVPFIYTEVSLDAIATTGITDKNELYKELTIGIDKSIKTQKYFYDILLTSKQSLADAENLNIKFAWVDRIGHAIMETIEVRIGGNKIDKHYGDWLNVWYELTANRDMEQIYFELIGNVKQLTNFDRIKKPAYVLRIPLQFWFCRFSGLSIPLVALEYHSVNIHIKFRKFEELCYIEPGTNIKYSKVSGGLLLDEVPNEMGINIQANLLIDYIYLDTSERKRFAQSSHEYLIEQLQVLSKNNVTQQKIQFNMNNFVHPSKEVIWLVQRESFTKNDDGTNKCRWDNYSINENNVGNPIAFSSMDFHSYKRIMRLDGNYFNYVQPYENHRTTPSDGINMYSFALFPEEHQPSGAANFSRLSRITIYMEFSDYLFLNGFIIDPLTMRIYTRNLNILRVLQGFGNIAYSYG